MSGGACVQNSVNTDCNQLNLPVHWLASICKVNVFRVLDKLTSILTVLAVHSIHCRLIMTGFMLNPK